MGIISTDFDEIVCQHDDEQDGDFHNNQMS